MIVSYRVRANNDLLQELLEGSQEYKRLEEVAKDYFKSHVNTSQPPTGQLILDLLKDIEFDVEEMKKSENSLPPSDGNFY